MNGCQARDIRMTKWENMESWGEMGRKEEKEPMLMKIGARVPRSVRAYCA
jgi:hypothetical protein